MQSQQRLFPQNAARTTSQPSANKRLSVKYDSPDKKMMRGSVDSNPPMSPSALEPSPQKEAQAMYNNRKSSYDFQISPTAQKSASASSHIDTLVDSSGSRTAEVVLHSPDKYNEEDEDDEGQQLQLASFHDFDDTQQMHYSPKDEELEERKGQASEVALHSMQESQVAKKKLSTKGNVDDDQSFNNDDDSVGQEYNSHSFSKKMLPATSADRISALKTFQESPTASGLVSGKQFSANSKPSHLGGISNRNKVKAGVRGSVVRQNFQQSLMAMNLPLRNNSNKLGKSNVLPMAQLLKPPLMKDKASAKMAQIQGNDEEAKSSYRHLSSERRPMQASQSIGTRFKHSRQLQQSHGNVSSRESTSCMGPKISNGLPPVSTTDFASSQFLLNQPEQEDRPPSPVNSLKKSYIMTNNLVQSSSKAVSPVSVSVPQALLFRGNTQHQAAAGGHASYPKSKTQEDSHLQGRPKQLNLSDHLTTEEEDDSPMLSGHQNDQSKSCGSSSPDSFGLSSHENYDVGATPNTKASQISQVQLIKTLSNQNTMQLQGLRFQERQVTKMHNLLIQKNQQQNNNDANNQSDESINDIASGLMKTVFSRTLKVGVNLSDSLKQARKYQLDANSQLTELKMPSMNLKFVSLNLFSKKLLTIDLSENKISSLPEEFVTIAPLQELKIDRNLLEALPRDFWKLSKLRKLNASHNCLKALPPNFEWLFCLEQLQVNENQIRQLPEKFGLLTSLNKLHLHDNNLATLPRDLSKLVNLTDFSIEWFMYTKPANSRITKNRDVIKSIRDFCHNFHFNPEKEAGTKSALKGLLKSNPIAEPSPPQSAKRKSPYVSFSDFIIQYHKIPHSDLSQVNRIDFTLKKRSLVHQICFNIHKHLLEDIMNITRSTDPDESTLNDNDDSENTAEPQSREALAKVINLNKKDTQSVVPVCLLVMNMTPIERKKKKEQAAKLASPVDDFAKSAATFFQVGDNGQDRQHSLNKKRKQMMRTLLDAKGADGEPLVDINGDVVKRSHATLHGLSSSPLVPQEQPSQHQPSGNLQHPILYWTVFKYQFKLAIELIERYGADPTVLNSNQSNLLHILFANFGHNMEYAPKLADLLLQRKVNLNLIDKDGKSPLLVAIKKSQLHAIEFAHRYNVNRLQTLCKDHAYVSSSNLIRTSMLKLELFNFEVKGRNIVSPIHYAIKKANYEAFMYLVRHQICDLLQRNEEQLTPRLTDLINSAFYRILLKEEKNQVQRMIARHEHILLQKRCQSRASRHDRYEHTLCLSLLGFDLQQHRVFLKVDHGEPKQLGPSVRVNDGQIDQLFMMRKEASEQSIANLFESVSLQQLHSQRDHLSANHFSVQNLHRVKLAEDQKALFEQGAGPKVASTTKNMERQRFSFAQDGLLAAQDEVSSSVGSPRMALFRPPPTQQIFKRKENLVSARNMHQDNLAAAGSGANNIETMLTEVIRFGDDNDNRNQVSGKVFVKNKIDAQMQFEQMNFVTHCVFSRRQVVRYSDDDDDEIQIVEVEEENISSSVVSPQYFNSGHKQFENRSSTFVFNEEKDKLEFTLGGGGLLGGGFGPGKVSENTRRWDKGRHKTMSVVEPGQLLESRRDYFHEDSPQPETTLFTPYRSDRQSSVKEQLPDPVKQFEISNTESEQQTTRLLNIEESQQNKFVRDLVAEQETQRMTNMNRISMFGNVQTKKRKFDTKNGVMKRGSFGMMQLYEKRSSEMKPISFKRPNIESPEKEFKRRMSDVSLPPSFRLNQEQQLPGSSRQARDIEANLTNCIDLEIQSDESNEDETRQGLVENVFSKADDIDAADSGPQEEVLEGPKKANSQLSEADFRDTQNFRSPHFNQERNSNALEGGNHHHKGNTENQQYQSHSVDTSMDCRVSNTPNVERKQINQTLPNQNLVGREDAKVEERKNIFISNMNININLNININMSERDLLSSSSSRKPKETTTGENDSQGGNHARRQQTQEQPHLSTILDEDQFCEFEHKPKPSLGSKVPLATHHQKNTSETSLRQQQLGHYIESQAKQITQEQILSQINPSQIVNAVSQHIQMQQSNQQRSAVAANGEYPLQQLFASTPQIDKTAQSQEKGNRRDSQKMFASCLTPDQSTGGGAGQSLMGSRKRFSPHQAFLGGQSTNQKNHLQKSVTAGDCGHSENIETSVMGGTPAKPMFDHSNLKKKQSRRLLRVQGGNSILMEDRYERCTRTERPVGRVSGGETQTSPRFHNDNLFTGGPRIEQAREYGMPTMMQVQSTETIRIHNGNHQLNSYLLTDNNLHTGKLLKNEAEGGVSGDHGVASMSNDGFLMNSISVLNGQMAANAYTLGNIVGDDHQVTLPSMTQVSNLVLQTGVSENGGVKQSPGQLNRNTVNKTATPTKIGRTLMPTNDQADKQMEDFAKTQTIAVIQQNEFISRGENQLAGNCFLREFKLICDKKVPDWLKYQTLYSKLAIWLTIVSGSQTEEDKQKKDAIQCLEQLVEVLSIQPCAILSDLIHLVSKEKLMRSRNDLIESTHTSLTLQRAHNSARRRVLARLEDNTNIYQREPFVSESSNLDSFCLLLSHFEAENARQVNEIYKKIQLKKFPTISKNLDRFLKSKRFSEKSNVKLKSKEEIKRTQNVPQSLQKRVKIEYHSRPHVGEQSFNEAVFTPRDPIMNLRNFPASLQPSPEQAVPQSHPTKLASQMMHLNAVSSKNRPVFQAKIHANTVEHLSEKQQKQSNQRNTLVLQDSSLDGGMIRASQDQPSNIQPIRNILSPKAFFPTTL